VDEEAVTIILVIVGSYNVIIKSLS